jgi:hypothetical protein
MEMVKDKLKSLSKEELVSKSQRLQNILNEYDWEEVKWMKDDVDAELERRKFRNRMKSFLNRVFNGIV